MRVNDRMTKLFELRHVTADLEIIGHQTLKAYREDAATEHVAHLRLALWALNTMQHHIKAASRSLHAANGLDVIEHNDNTKVS